MPKMVELCYEVWSSLLGGFIPKLKIKLEIEEFSSPMNKFQVSGLFD